MPSVARVIRDHGGSPPDAIRFRGRRYVKELTSDDFDFLKRKAGRLRRNDPDVHGAVVVRFDPPLRGGFPFGLYVDVAPDRGLSFNFEDLV